MPHWQEPRILRIDALPAGLGHCADGSTPQAQACANGQNTGVAEHYCRAGGQGVGQLNGSGCDSGGTVFSAACISGDSLHV